MLERLKTWGAEVGLHRPSVAPLPPPAAWQRNLTAFLAQGRHGTMGYMAAPARLDLNQVLPAARSALLFWLPYRGPNDADLKVLADKRLAYVSRYATATDYHHVARAKLEQLLARIEQAGWGGHWRPFVDSAPVPEKVLAASAGMGFQGRHTNLIVPGAGSYGFLCGLLSDVDPSWLLRSTPAPTLPLPGGGGHAATCDAANRRPFPSQGVLRQAQDERKTRWGFGVSMRSKVGSCGTCRDCIPACPTGALDGDGRIESRKCISYLTIEHKGSIPVALRPLIGNRIFGCDDCQWVCPFNRRSPPADPLMRLPEAWQAPSLGELLLLPSGELKRRMKGSAMERLGVTRLRRNVAVALGNGVDQAGEAALHTALTRDIPELVREHVVWALNQRQRRSKR